MKYFLLILVIVLLASCSSAQCAGNRQYNIELADNVWFSVFETDITAEQFIAQVLAENIAEIAGDEPLRALQIQEYTTAIGQYDWYSYSYWGLDGGFVRVFIRVSDGYMYQITVIYGSEEELYEILASLEHLS